MRELDEGLLRYKVKIKRSDHENSYGQKCHSPSKGEQEIADLKIWSYELEKN